MGWEGWAVIVAAVAAVAAWLLPWRQIKSGEKIAKREREEREDAELRSRLEALDLAKSFVEDVRQHARNLVSGRGGDRSTWTINVENTSARRWLERVDDPTTPAALARLPVAVQRSLGELKRTAAAFAKTCIERPSGHQANYDFKARDREEALSAFDSVEEAVARTLERIDEERAVLQPHLNNTAG